ncbi:microviridin/marinostatin family tricyclic proteinase inhibitor [uncultured Chryseobacterium sp.]|uniref:microviridin/marinostatin family tricyclic proteinase inhibitor n=1 Tax=uncultured Chryseobacterium sp. TaxID=259322 RepID=UPI0025D76A87|nr:microviridin/marinostatin family tricyclic proteinase inhibitor [uncultured Chryseobacterium sp.]
MKNKNSKKPFFASFLEKQIQEPQKVRGGDGTSTGVLKDAATSPVTDSLTKPGEDTVSMKYPSDSDEEGYEPEL